MSSDAHHTHGLHATQQPPEDHFVVSEMDLLGPVSLKGCRHYQNVAQNIGLIDPISPLIPFRAGRISSDILTIAQVCSRPVSITSLHVSRGGGGAEGSLLPSSRWHGSVQIAILPSLGREDRLTKDEEESVQK